MLVCCSYTCPVSLSACQRPMSELNMLVACLVLNHDQTRMQLSPTSLLMICINKGSHQSKASQNHCDCDWSAAGGRYLNDVWVLSLDNLTWQLVTTSAKPLPPVGGGIFDEIESEVSTPLLGHKEDSSKPSSSALPPSAGHVLLAWGSNLLCIGGHTKAGTYSHLRKVFTGQD